MSWIIVALLIVAGLILLLLELLVVPGTTVVGIIGFILISIGVWQSFAFGNTYGIITLVATLFISLIAVYYSLRSDTWNKAMLHKSITSKVNKQAESVKVGDVGQTISRINPMGKAMFNNKYYEVSSLGAMIDENSDIKIIEINTNKIIIELIDSSKEQIKK